MVRDVGKGKKLVKKSTKGKRKTASHQPPSEKKAKKDVGESIQEEDVFEEQSGALSTLGESIYEDFDQYE